MLSMTSSAKAHGWLIQRTPRVRVADDIDLLAGGKLDVLDRRLISELQADPRLPYATLGS
ncbi:MAG: AsnC family transcriptional regulator, partial [Tepidiformaceae bacterium]